MLDPVEPEIDPGDRITTAFRTLANEHAATREAAEADRAWRFIQSWQRAKRRNPPALRPTRWWFGIAAAAAAALFTMSWLHRPEHALDYVLQGATVDDGFIQAADGPASLDFNDGSHIGVSAGTNLGVRILGERAVSTRLSRGKLHVEVQRSDNADWQFLAGPYEVHVVGTAFDLSWDPIASRLHLTMYEGTVQVVGPDVGVVHVHAGESLRIPEDDPQVATVPAPGREADTRDLDERAEGTPGGGKDDTAAVAAPRPARKRVASSSTREPSWARRVAKGEFEMVVEAATAYGIDRVLQQHDAEAIKALAQAAQYTGRTPLAIRGWSTLRDRFAKHPAGRQAAFFLGRLHDAQGSLEEALHWLDIYLGESESGVYASEALGRKLTLVRRLRGPAAARHVARAYLERFPQGPYASGARDVLGDD